MQSPNCFSYLPKHVHLQSFTELCSREVVKKEGSKFSIYMYSNEVPQNPGLNLPEFVFEYLSSDNGFSFKMSETCSTPFDEKVLIYWKLL